MDPYQQAGISSRNLVSSGLKTSGQAPDKAILYVKHDNIVDRLKTIRERSKNLASSELMDALDSSYAL
jgi:hypothetical protein